MGSCHQREQMAGPKQTAVTPAVYRPRVAAISKSCKHRYPGGTMTSGTSLVGIATFEQATHAACASKLLGRSAKTVTTEDYATSRCICATPKRVTNKGRRVNRAYELPGDQRKAEGRGLLQRGWRAIQPAVGWSNDRGTAAAAAATAVTQRSFQLPT